MSKSLPKSPQEKLEAAFTKETYDKTRSRIINTPKGPYWHNIVALELQSLAKLCGNKVANKLIDELKLDFSKGSSE